MGDLGEPVSKHDKPDWMWLKHELADQLASAGNLDEAAGMMAQLTVLLLRDGLACCRRMSSRPYSNTGLHSVIAWSLAQLIVKSCDDGDAPCGSLAEAEGMLREARSLAAK